MQRKLIKINGKFFLFDKLLLLDEIVTGVLNLEPEKLTNRNMSYRNQLKQIFLSKYDFRNLIISNIQHVCLCDSALAIFRIDSTSILLPGHRMKINIYV